MKAFYQYGFLVLGFLILSNISVKAQAVKELKSLKENRQLEKGVVEVDEVEPLVFNIAPEIHMITRSGYNGNSSMRISKKMDDLSRSRKFTFNVEDDYLDVYFRIIGQVEQGYVNIKLLKPDQKVLKEIKIVPGQEQNWDQSYSLLELKDNNFIGKWSVELSCSEASGYYQFQFRSR